MNIFQNFDEIMEQRVNQGENSLREKMAENYSEQIQLGKEFQVWKS